MGRLIATTNLKREPGMLYFVKEDKEGNLGMWEAVMKRGGRKKKVQK